MRYNQKKQKEFGLMYVLRKNLIVVIYKTRLIFRTIKLLKELKLLAQIKMPLSIFIAVVVDVQKLH